MDYLPHFLNAAKCNILGHNHGYSCSIDCIIEIFHYGIFPYINVEPYINHPFIGKLFNILMAIPKSKTPTCAIREDLWDWLVQNLPEAFAPKGRVDAEILRAFEILTVEMFESCLVKKLFCQTCKKTNEVRLSLGPVYDYLVSIHEMFGPCGRNSFSAVVEQCIEQSTLQKLGKPLCHDCNSHLRFCENFRADDVEMSDILILNIGLVNGENLQNPPICVPQNMEVYGTSYMLSSAIQMEPSHFVSICIKW